MVTEPWSEQHSRHNGDRFAGEVGDAWSRHCAARLTPSRTDRRMGNTGQQAEANKIKNRKAEVEELMGAKRENPFLCVLTMGWSWETD